MTLLERLGVFCVRLAVILIGAGLILCLPDPVNGEVLFFKNGAVAFVTVILIGKLLLDTLFFDRYFP